MLNKAIIACTFLKILTFFHLKLLKKFFFWVKLNVGKILKYNCEINFQIFLRNYFYDKK